MIARSFAVICSFAFIVEGQVTPAVVDYDRQVHPIFAAKCFSCHNLEKRSGGLSLFSYEDALNGGRNGGTIRPGKSGNSLLVMRISGETEPRMPLGGSALSDAEIQTIRAWIDQGARRSPTAEPAKAKWEAPLELDKPAVPGIVWQNWSSPIDRFAAAYMKTNGVAEPEPVSDRVFARRVYLDVWGLLPTPGELQAFLKDRSPNKREQLVVRLLADSQKYAENWISYWNDLLRNDEGVSYHAETAGRKSISKWLMAALQNNLPYDQFVYKLLNPAAPTDPEGFLIGVNWRGVVNASMTPAMQAAQNTAQIFLGINLKCNSCHDSFISKWKLKDAYSLAGFFAKEEKLQLVRCDVAQDQFATPAFLYPALNRVPASQSMTDRRLAAAEIFTDPRNGRLARTLVNRLWQRLLGRGIVENPDEMDGEPWSPGLLDWMASDFADSHYDMKKLLAAILTSRAYQMPSVAQAESAPAPFVFRGPEVRRITAEQFADAIASITGEWHVYQPPSDPPPSAPKPAADQSQVPKPDDQTPQPQKEEPTPPLVHPKPGEYSREWRISASSLTRALGRPIRDQVYSVRDNQPTTLQALELVNGEALTHWLNRGARKMLGVLPVEPASIFDQPLKRKGSAPFDVDISKAQQLWLLVTDEGSYSPEKVEAMWSQVELVAGDKITPLSSLTPVDAVGIRSSTSPLEASNGVRVKTPSRVVYNIGRKGFTSLRGLAALENKDVSNDINPDIRFFIFQTEPNPQRLTPVIPATPVEAQKTPGRTDKLVDQLFWYAFDRAPLAAERKAAIDALRDDRDKKKISPDALADLLWAMVMKPEFQLIY